MSLAESVAQRERARSDSDLVAEARRGIDEAFGELYARYRSRIRAYALSMVGDHGRAEDVVQEVFISALRRLRSTDTPIAFKPWIYEIAKNACIDEFRRLKRAQEVPLEPREETDAGVAGMGVTPAPELVVENKERLRDLRWAFHSLSENHHRIIVMRELEGLSYGQIGERMGMSKPIVESTLFRARRRLSEEYNELATGRRCADVQTAIACADERPLTSLGLRQRRKLARHLAHCQPCRRTARLAGVDESFFTAPTVVGKIAALLPWPWLRVRRPQRDNDGGPGAGADLPVSMRPFQVVTRFADSAAPLPGLGRAAAAAAALAVTGAGGGIVTGLTARGDVKPRSVQALARAAAIASARAQRGGPSAGGAPLALRMAAVSSSDARRRFALGAAWGGGLGSPSTLAGAGSVKHAGAATSLTGTPAATGSGGAAQATGATGANVTSAANGTGTAVGGVVGAPPAPGIPRLNSGTHPSPPSSVSTPTAAPPAAVSPPAVRTPAVSPPTPPVRTPGVPTPAVPTPGVTASSGPNPLAPIPRPPSPAVNVKVPAVALPSFSVPSPGPVPSPAPSGIIPPVGHASG